MSSSEKLHGSMFLVLQRFVESKFNKEMWAKLLESIGKTENYKPEVNYPMLEMDSLISNVSVAMGISEYELKEQFGYYLVPGLLEHYQKYVNPTWKTYDMLVYTETVMHHAVRKENENADPPTLNISKVSEKLLIIDYFSKRKMAPLAIGIIKGIANHYNESEKVEIVPITNPNDERVQIRVNFKD